MLPRGMFPVFGCWAEASIRQLSHAGTWEHADAAVVGRTGAPRIPISMKPQPRVGLARFIPAAEVLDHDDQLLDFVNAAAPIRCA